MKRSTTPSRRHFPAALDALLLLCWRLLRPLSLAAGMLLRLAGWWLRALFRLTDKAVGRQLRPRTDPAPFATWRALGNSGLTLGRRLRDRLDRSAPARRWFFLFLLLALAAWYYGGGEWIYRSKGLASWYGPGFYGRKTASGEILREGGEMTAAHRYFPLGSRVLVVNDLNGREAEVRINDRGPYVPGRIIDLSHAAARRLGIFDAGTAPVTLYRRE